MRALTPALLLLLALESPESPRRSQAHDVVVATTTSLHDTGLLDSLSPVFEQRTGYRLRVVAVGSGQAMRLGERGDADAVLAHSPAAEEAFMREGHGSRRRVVASNYFTIAGPPEDPARVREAPGAAAALLAIARRGSPFASRGDSSGTHQLELRLWRQVGGRPPWPAYLETGQGMAATLLVADERRAYVLTDRSTLGALRRRLELLPLRNAEADLLNVYHVIEVSSEGRPRVNAAGARAFADFMTSKGVQDYLETFGRDRYGEALFVPARGREPAP